MVVQEEVDLEEQRLLVERAKNGDLDAVGILYDSHINQVYRYALARLGNVHDAEDVAEEIMHKMLTGLSSYNWRRVPFAAWLIRIARNEVVSFARRNSRRKQLVGLPEELEDTKWQDVADSVERDAKLLLINAAIAKLSESQREIITLRFSSGLSVSDTAKALGKTENNIKVQQTKAIARLTYLLGPQIKGEATLFPKKIEKRRSLNVDHVKEVTREAIRSGIPEDSVSLETALEKIGYSEAEYRRRYYLFEGNIRGGLKPYQFLTLKVVVLLETSDYSLGEIFEVWRYLPFSFFKDELRYYRG